MGLRETEQVINEPIPVADLKYIEAKYRLASKNQSLTQDDEFQYACCLVKSQYEDDVKKGMKMFKNLVDNSYAGARECLYYLAVGNYKLKEYSQALPLISLVLEKEPSNSQAQDLKQLIVNKQRRDGIIGAAVLGGAASVGLIGALAAGALLAFSRKR
ncbi:mitochondrial fission 1 protein-like [Symsagittifera roscoffensis]|uniref:mitochondrial fission 1 protein-like n=1 Tax=Symsagittifera roscoffensis TaxID=84072 RepID=UPI00307C9D54